MKKRLGVIALVVGAAWCASTALAVTQFRTQFVARYVKKDSNDPKDRAFAELVERAGCNICHLGDDKTKRNAYGQALDKLLDRKTDARDKEKIQKALEIVEKEKVDPKDPKSPTFGDRIKAGKLPVDVPPELME
ncbi:hypothetical protein [Thermogutta sp.]|jgi:hypothetical protein|uniref:hypothetical protein n=1 Tax=Thermogutta sp. TaxID=1962930 RepID=UPI00321FF944